MLLDVYKITTFLIPITAFGVGFYSLYLNPKSKLVWLWFLTSIFVGIWGVGLSGLLMAKDAGQAMFWDRVLYLGVSFIPALYLHFLLTFLRQNRKLIAFVVVPSYVISTFFAVLALTSNIFIADAIPLTGFDYWVKGGPLYAWFVVYFYILVVISFAFLLRNYFKSDGIIKKQIGYIILASLIGFVAGGTCFLPQLFGIYPFGNFITFIYPLLITYGIFLK
ncbi:MAG: histidine kinase N-terminal 7TM domain-containing protein [Patescibacteria group bacterium]|jgi:hypothetical protein